MARFHVETRNSRGKAISTIGHHDAIAVVEGWSGGIKVYVYKDENDVDRYQVYMRPHSDDHSGGREILLSSGALDYNARVRA